MSYTEEDIREFYHVLTSYDTFCAALREIRPITGFFQIAITILLILGIKGILSGKIDRKNIDFGTSTIAEFSLMFSVFFMNDIYSLIFDLVAMIYILISFVRAQDEKKIKVVAVIIFVSCVVLCVVKTVKLYGI